MSTGDWIALGTVLVYSGQLVVLILVYFRVIKEANRNAEIRKQEIEKAGSMMQEMGKDMERRLNRMAKRNTAAMTVMVIALTGLLFTYRKWMRQLDARVEALEKRWKP